MTEDRSGSNKRRDCIRAAAEFMAAQPGGPQRMLELHDRREDGNCGGCRGVLTRWPCALAIIARLAAG